jgi:hypothetical protein
MKTGESSIVSGILPHSIPSPSPLQHIDIAIAETGFMNHNWGSLTPKQTETLMIKIIPFALLAGLFLASCDCLSDICGCCDEGEAAVETPSEN